MTGRHDTRSYRALVTGATGFLGGAVARRLAAEGWQVTGLGRNPQAGAALTAAGIRFLAADLRHRDAVIAACAGQDLVFHAGAAVATWGRYADFHATNVGGTEAVIEGCRRHSVRRLVHVSTPSIYFGFQDRLDVREDASLPERQPNAYAATKLLAEAHIAAAHQAGLPVVTLRPRALFGPGDPTIFPRVIEAVQRERLRIVGNGDNVQDLSYIDNIVDGLIAAGLAGAHVLGKVYNLTNDEPVRVWDKLRMLCAQLSLPFPHRRVPFRVAFAAASAMETLYTRLPALGEPPLTRYTVSLLACSMTLSLAAARADLDYRPRVTVDEGIARFVAWRRFGERGIRKGSS